MPNKQLRKRSTATVDTIANSTADRDNLRVAVRKLDERHVLNMLDDASGIPPPAQLAGIVVGKLDRKPLRTVAPGETNLLADVRAFDAASRAGKYYQSFNVKSKNFMDHSPGTRAFLVDCNRLLDRCVMQAQNDAYTETREAIAVMLALLARLDEGYDDIVFFADEGDSWQVGVDWPKVLAAHFLCLSRTTDPQEFARCVIEVVDKFDRYDREKHIAAARRVATAAQRNALEAFHKSFPA